ncbi:MAG: 4Fe-4S cluster-binding domain-containing protein [Oscillospiraceae bacterium]
MKIKTLIDEDFTNYKKPSLFIGTALCDWKCCTEQGLPISTCQNQPLVRQENKEISKADLVKRYISNPITQAVVFGGLEPMLQIDDIVSFINLLRHKGCNDDVVIYTGYYPEEVVGILDILKCYQNIVVKFGRYMPNSTPHYDEALGVNLASDNQFAKRIS